MKPISASREPVPGEMRALEADELEPVAAAGSKPGGTGDGRGLLSDRHEAS